MSIQTNVTVAAVPVQPYVLNNKWYFSAVGTTRPGVRSQTWVLGFKPVIHVEAPKKKWPGLFELSSHPSEVYWFENQGTALEVLGLLQASRSGYVSFRCKFKIVEMFSLECLLQVWIKWGGKKKRVYKLSLADSWWSWGCHWFQLSSWSPDPWRRCNSFKRMVYHALKRSAKFHF